MIEMMTMLIVTMVIIKMTKKKECDDGYSHAVKESGLNFEVVNNGGDNVRDIDPRLCPR